MDENGRQGMGASLLSSTAGGGLTDDPFAIEAD